MVQQPKRVVFRPVSGAEWLSLLLISVLLFVGLKSFAEDPASLEKATQMYERTEAEFTLAFGEPIDTITRSDIDSHKRPWPPEWLKPDPTGKPTGKCVFYSRGARVLMIYFDAQGRCYRVQSGFS